MADVDMTMPVVVWEDEERILNLYDRLRILEFRLARVRAQKVYKMDTSQPVTARMLDRAREQLLESKALHSLRNSVTDDVMMAQPVLNAVHGAVRASPIEQDLLPYIQQRDEMASAVATQTTDLQEVTDRLAEVETESILIGRENAKLASQLLALAETMKQDTADALDEPDFRAKIEQLEKELKASRQKWRVMKDTASAVVVGSGVDWARDEDLRSMVLDDE